MPIKKVVSDLIMARYIVYKGITSQKITEFYTKWFSVCPNITSKF
jgi:hypothetical protein